MTWRHLATLILCATTAACTTTRLDFTEITIAELQDRFEREELSSEQLVDWYLRRIEHIDQSGPALGSVLEQNPDAREIARALDRERAEQGSRGPLHGIPVLLKGNIDTADAMATSAGSLALRNHYPPADADLVTKLRTSGAVILGKANLSEWANFRSSHSSSGWSSVGGQTRNPYDPTRNPCGSSSGSAVAVAANLVTVAVGTETDGSVVCPSGANGIVGIKPTLGLISGAGIVPIAHSQDTAGPMARTVRDAAILLGAMASDDAADYTALLSADALQEKRIGILRSHYGAGDYPAVEEVLDSVIASLRAAGAEVIDNVEVDSTGMNDAEYEVLLYEFKSDLEQYLQSTNAPLQTLQSLIEFNDNHRDAVMPIFGQDIFLDANEKGPLTEPAYLEALEASKRIARDGIDGALNKHELDAIIALTNSPAWYTDHVNGDSYLIGSSSLAAVSGYPNITVPAGFVSGLPIGVSFMGAANHDRDLIALAYAYEQASNARRPPAH